MISPARSAWTVGRTTTSLHSDDTSRQLGKELGNGIPPQGLAQNDPAARVDRVNLKHMLGQIQANPNDLHNAPPLRLSTFQRLGMFCSWMTVDRHTLANC
jgi:hypothetical protein